MHFRQKRVLVVSLVSMVLVGAPLFMAVASQQATAHPGTSAHPTKSAPPMKSAIRLKAGQDYFVTPGLNRRATFALDGFDEALGSDKTYAGVEIQRSGVLFYYVGRPSAAYTARLAALPKTLVWNTKKVPNSLASLMSLTAQIDEDVKKWTREGVNLSSWGPNLAANHVTLTLAVSTSKVSYRVQAAKLVDAYGKHILQVAGSPGIVVPAHTAL